MGFVDEIGRLVRTLRTPSTSLGVPAHEPVDPLTGLPLSPTSTTSTGEQNGNAPTTEPGAGALVTDETGDVDVPSETVPDESLLALDRPVAIGATTDAAVPVAAESAVRPSSLDADALARLEAAAGVAESLGLGFHLGGAVERIALGAGGGGDGVLALREAAWLIERYIGIVEQRPLGADLHASSVRLGRSGEALAELRALTEALGSQPAEDPALPPAIEVSQGGEQRSAPSEPDPAEPNGAEVVAEASPSAPPAEPDSFGREVALMAIRWTIMTVAVIVVVLAVTLIGEWV